MKQKNIKLVGVLFDSMFTVLPILAIVNYLSIATLLYTSIREQLLAWAPWMQLWIFLLILIAVGFMLMIVTYKWVLPSIWTFRGKQMFSHDSQVMDELAEINKRLNEMSSKLNVEKEKEMEKVR